MAEQITFDVLARDRASQTFNKIAKSTETLETRFTRLTRAATGIATTLVGAELGRSVLEAADKFELSRSRLETITKNTGASFEELSGQIAAADDRMSKFGFTSAEAEGSLADLESVTRDPVKAFKDLALAADIARGRNIGLSEATLILQRVETGHVAQLAKLGIATKDANGHLLTQGQALQMLSDLYGGAASRYAGTFAGKQAALAAEMKNSAAEIGVALLPAAVDLANVIQHDLLPPLIDTAKWLDRNRKTVEPLVKALLITVAGWKAYTLATKAAAAATALFSKSAVTAAAATTAESAAAASAGKLIGTEMAAGLGVAALAASRLLTLLKNIGPATFGGIPDLGPKTDTLPDGHKVSGNAPQGVKDLLTAQNKLIKTNPAAAADFKRMVGNDGVIHESVEQLKSWVAKWTAATVAIHGTTAAETALTSATGRTVAQLAAHVQHALALRSAQDGLRQALHAAAQAAADNGRALVGNSDAALANRDALRNEVAQVFSVIDAMKARNASDQQQAQMLAILSGVVEQNAVSLYGDKKAVDAFLASLGLIPGAAQNAASALASYANAAIAADQALDPRKIAAASKVDAAAKQQATTIAKSFSTGFTPVVSKAAKDGAKAAESAFNKMRDRMNSDVDSIRGSIDSMRSSLEGFADVASNLSGTDTLGASGTLPFISTLSDKATQLTQFARLFGQLRKAGVDPRLLLQFEAAGPDAIPAMQELLSSGRAGVRRVNALERQIATAAGQVATQGAALENNALIHRDLQTLPTKLAKTMASQLRHMGLVVSLREADRKAGKRIVILG